MLKREYHAKLEGVDAFTPHGRLAQPYLQELGLYSNRAGGQERIRIGGGGRGGGGRGRGWGSVGQDQEMIKVRLSNT